jgi:hypothetical protein
VIVPAGWMNAGNADWLREKLAGTLRLDELFLFGGFRLFAPEAEARARTHRPPTPTVESAILIATKGTAPKGHKMRVVALEDEAAAAFALSGSADVRAPDRHDLLVEMAKRADGRQGRKGGIHVHDVPQRELEADRPWPVKHGAKDVGPRVVAHLQRLIGDPAVAVEEMGSRWSIPQGVQTGADAYTLRIQRRLRSSFPAALQQLEAAGAELGEPILELPPGKELEAPWKDHSEVLARSIEPHAILYGALDEGNYTSLVWLGRDDEAPTEVVKALEEWRPVLANRADFLANPERRWWEAHRTRDKDLLCKPKVIALYRTDRGRFSVDLDGSWQPSIKTTLVIPTADSLSVAYLGGLLNSELLDLWYAVRGKTPWHVRRNYEPKRMKEIPYRHVELAGAVPKEIKDLRKDLTGRDLDRGLKMVESISQELRGAGEVGLEPDAPEAVQAARALEALVMAIADNRRALLPFRDRFPALSRVVKDPWSTEVVDPVADAFVAGLPKRQRASVRVDPELVVEISTDGGLGRAQMEEGALVFRYRRQKVARVVGPAEKLTLLAELCSDLDRPLPADLLKVEVPREVARFKEEVDAATAEVRRLLAEGRQMVEAAERLVCALYAVPKELEDEVVAHALARAKAVAGVE